MKKVLCICFISLLSVFLFSSCSKPTTDTIMKKVSHAMDKVSSYEAESELDISALYDITDMYIRGDAKEIFSKKSGSGLYFYSQDDVYIKYGNVKTATSMLEAYNDGLYFFSCEVGENENKFFSENTEQEFLDYYEKNLEFANLFSGYGEITLVTNDDKSYEITLDNYDDKTIRAVNYSYGFPFEEDGDEIIGIKVVILADSKYLIQEVNIEYIFSQEKFFGWQKTTFSNYGSAEKITDTINPENYESVTDARVLPLLSLLLNEKHIADSGSLESSSETVATTGASQKQENKIKYSYKDGKIEFEARMKSDDEIRKVTYEDGVYTSDGKKIPEYTEYQAKSFIESQIDPYSFIPISVNQIKKEEKNNGSIVYTLTIDTENSMLAKAFKEAFVSTQVKNFSLDIKIKFEVADYELKSVTYLISLDVKNENNYNSNQGIEIKTKTSFKD